MTEPPTWDQLAKGAGLDPTEVRSETRRALIFCAGMIQRAEAKTADAKADARLAQKREEAAMQEQHHARNLLGMAERRLHEFRSEVAEMRADLERRRREINEAERTIEHLRIVAAKEPQE